MAALSIGRHSGCDIVVDDPGVSRHHADLTPAGGGRFRLRDTDSSGGTFVKDGQLWRRVQRTVVSMGDTVRIGSSEFTIADLVGRLRDHSAALETPAEEAGANPRRPEAPARAVRYERDPVTGQIVEKR